MTQEECIKLIEENFSKIQEIPRHPLENIAIVFSPLVPDNQIWYMKKMKYFEKKVLLVSLNLKNVWEELEEKEGVRAERIGERMNITPHPLPEIPMRMDDKNLLYNLYDCRNIHLFI